MNGTKNLFTSNTIWGLILAAVARWLFPHWGLTEEDLGFAADQFAQAAGLVWAAYGRVRARSALTLGKGSALGAIAVLAALLGGCALDPERARGASQEYAGIADYRITPVFAEGATEPAYRIEIRNGKEIGKLKLRAYKLESGEVQIELDQEDTRAFEGQRISAAVVVQIAQDLARELRETVGLSAEAAGPIVLRVIEALVAP